MSDFLDSAFHHSQSNILGGHDFFNSTNQFSGHTQSNIFGGHDIYGADGQQVAHTQPNIFSGVDVMDNMGSKGIHTQSGTMGTTDVFNNGQHIGHGQISPNGGNFTDFSGFQSSWQNNILGGVTMDPMSQINGITFPPLL